MKINLVPSNEFVPINGHMCRVWHGTTDRGTPCFAYILRFSLPIDGPEDEARELLELAMPPDAVVVHVVIDDETQRKDTN